MFGSQALETAIGLTLMFFIISVGASTLVELGSRFAQKRAKELEKAIGGMLAGVETRAEATSALKLITNTSVYKSLKISAKQRPSYMSAKSFADAVAEGLVQERQLVGTLP